MGNFCVELRNLKKYFCVELGKSLVELGKSCVELGNFTKFYSLQRHELQGLRRFEKIPTYLLIYYAHGGGLTPRRCSVRI